jgi:hypothetical protein
MNMLGVPKYTINTRPCMNLHGMYRWLGVVPQGLVLSLPLSPLVIFGALSCDFLGIVLRVFSWGFLLGVTYEDLVPLWLVTLPQELSWIDLDLVVFRVARVLDLEGLIPQFPLILGVSVRFLWGRGCPRGNPIIPEVSPQSVRWIGRSGDKKLRVDPRPDFLGRAV